MKIKLIVAALILLSIIQSYAELGDNSDQVTTEYGSSTMLRHDPTMMTADHYWVEDFNYAYTLVDGVQTIITIILHDGVEDTEQIDPPGMYLPSNAKQLTPQWDDAAQSDVNNPKQFIPFDDVQKFLDKYQGSSSWNTPIHLYGPADETYERADGVVEIIVFHRAAGDPNIMSMTVEYTPKYINTTSWYKKVMGIAPATLYVAPAPTP